MVGFVVVPVFVIGVVVLVSVVVVALVALVVLVVLVRVVGAALVTVGVVVLGVRRARAVLVADVAVRVLSDERGQDRHDGEAERERGDGAEQLEAPRALVQLGHEIRAGDVEEAAGRDGAEVGLDAQVAADREDEQRRRGSTPRRWRR